MPHPRRVYTLVIALLATLAAAPSTGAAQNPDSVRVHAALAELTFAGRVETQFNTSSVDGVASTHTFLRRARFGVDFRLNDFISGRIHPDFASERLSLGDAYAQLTFSPTLQLQVGRFRRPFAVMEETSSLAMPVIERGLRIRGVSGNELSGVLAELGHTARDVGVKIQGSPAGAPLGLEYDLALVAGPLQQTVQSEVTQQLVGRVAVSPLERVRIGVAWSHRDFVGTPPAEEVQAGNAFVLNLETGSSRAQPGAYLIAQASVGDLDPALDEGFSGIQVWTGYRVPLGGRVPLIEPMFRISHASLDHAPGVPSGGGTLVTPGFNVYLGGLNRVLFNYDIWTPEAGDTEGSFKAQFQVAF